MFKYSGNSLCFDVGERYFGEQDRGVSPSGASDQLSFLTAKALLGEPERYRCAEIVFCPSVIFTEEVLFTLTGAHYARMVLHREGRETELDHATVYKAHSGDTLTLGGLQKGFRLYLFATPLTAANAYRIGLSRGPFTRWFEAPPRKVRVMKGPEHGYLNDKRAFLNRVWKISTESNRMGIRLRGEALPGRSYDIVSSAVDDGTIQLTPSGPVVLLRERQTTGGYPRIFQAANVDIDTLAQYPVGTGVAFDLIGMDEAKALLEERQKQITAFKKAFL